MSKAKLVCTLGPATDRPGVLSGLLRAGMHCARFNFSHGLKREHARRFKQLQHEACRQKKVITTLMDLCGPKLRVGRLRHGPLELSPQKEVVLVPPGMAGTAGVIPLQFAGLARHVRPGNRVLLDDGLLQLEVVKARGQAVICRVRVGGVLSEGKGVNLPDVILPIPALTQKDKQDLEFGLNLGVDYVALSFVRRPEEIEQLRRRIVRHPSSAQIIAKIEKPQALPRLEEIIRAADGVMVARGDLGVEMSPEQVPTLQKRIIAMANHTGRLVITATQMLQSMMHNPTPTRAEASDVANAIFDGSDAVMLSGETAAGDYPRQAAAMMTRVIHEAEGSPEYNRLTTPGNPEVPEDVIVAEGVDLAERLRARWLVVFTRTGNTARRVSRQRPQVPLVVLAHDARVQRQLQLYWGIEPLLIQSRPDVEGVVQAAERTLHQHRMIRRGDVLVLLASSPRNARVNFIKVHTVG